MLSKPSLLKVDELRRTFLMSSVTVDLPQINKNIPTQRENSILKNMKSALNKIFVKPRKNLFLKLFNFEAK